MMRSVFVALCFWALLADGLGAQGTTRFWGDASSTSLPVEFSLCFWNIHKIESEQTLEDINSLSLESDLLLLQEAINVEDLSSRYDGVFAHSWGKTGVATLARVIQNNVQAIISKKYELGLFTPKVILISHFDAAGSDLLVVNVHALNFVSLKAFKSHIDQIVRSIENHRGPIIVAGDFNTWLNARTDYLNQELGKLEIKEIDFTPNGELDARRGIAGLLDRAYSRGLEVTSVEIKDQMNSSDHIPSCATFAL